MVSKGIMLALVGLVALGLLLVPLPAAPAQAKKKNEELAKARQRIEQLERLLKEKELRIDQLQALLKREKRDDRKDDERIQQLQRQLRDKDQRIDSLQTELKQKTSTVKKGAKEVDSLGQRLKDLEALKKAAFVHAVVYRLKAGSSEEQVQAMIDDVTKTLAKVATVRGFWVGKPAEKGTPELADTNYQVGVVVLLDNPDALGQFLDDPRYQKLAARLAKNWEKPTVYDFQRQPE